MIHVYDVMCEGQRFPLALRVLRPRFSWKIGVAEGLRNVVQEAFQIQVALDEGFTSPVWDSGMVRGGMSQWVEYGGADLAPCTRYYVRVRTKVEGGACSPWSEPVWFETGLPEWSAPFVSPEPVERMGQSSRPRYLRREFWIDTPVVRARLYATALGLYELSINGRRVGDSYFTPGWTSYHHRVLYQTYDVTDYLQPGKTVIAGIVANGWYRGELTWFLERNLYGREIALSVDLRWKEEGGEGRLVTDSTWRSSDGPLVYAELYHGEVYDARLEVPGWDLPGFDDGEWEECRVLEMSGRAVEAQEAPPVRIHERLAPVRIVTTPRGEKVLDFGQNLTGWVRFRVRGRRGDRVKLRHAEVLDREGNFYTENLRKARNTIEYVLKGDGVEEFSPRFSFQGFRYVCVDEWPDEVEPSSFTAEVLHSDMEPLLEFRCSHEPLNRLHHNIQWSWKGNSLAIPTDCPQRDERLGWTGDAAMFVGTATYLSDARSFLLQWLVDMTLDQRRDGAVPFVVPDVLSLLEHQDPNFREPPFGSAGWGDAITICPWILYRRYGDRRVLERLYPAMKRWVEYMRAQARDGLVWERGFHFGDWVALDAEEGSYVGLTPLPLIATAFYALSTEILAHAARVLGLEEDERRYTGLHKEIAEAWYHEFFTGEGRLRLETQTGYTLGLAFGLVPESAREKAAARLADLVREKGHLTTGFLGTPFLLRVLSDHGYTDLAYTLLLRDEYPSWLYEVEAGATTIWEHWDGIKPDGTMWSPQMNSFNHYAYGAVGEWMYTVMGGIRVDDGGPGFSSFSLEPLPSRYIPEYSVRYRSPYGVITSAWRIEGDSMHWEFEVPPNTKATVRLWGVRSASVREGEGLGFQDRMVGGIPCATTVLGSGCYRLVSPVPERRPRS
ncbi:alpha-L-rhamnosidase [Spirochaeta thermophila DSM 6578]|uniref:alpha-L-rhamnosidase n=1 Tax=Winmispira thermophila (strain ATCC 700085 / DSM 6578 / Z-1203) TaxID=869211 RepID=G0GFH7_WINT7|nr:alpha-L-rhamnosidase [Spirochaeta thermophila]AEJ61591.1 alpha-L-rhamnosidase [Spirochaeta thermophila DSM 6578]